MQVRKTMKPTVPKTTPNVARAQARKGVLRTQKARRERAEAQARGIPVFELRAENWQATRDAISGAALRAQREAEAARHRYW